MTEIAAHEYQPVATLMDAGKTLEEALAIVRKQATARQDRPGRAKGGKTNPVPQISEAAFQRAVTDMADGLGWQWHHETYSLGTKPGYPDLTLVHPDHGILWLELKAHRGKVSAAQQAWIDRLTEAGQRAYIVYPSDMDRIVAMLRGELAS